MPNPQAKMGFVGSATFLGTTGGNIRVRATSCDVAAKQQITAPDVIDGKIDRTAYQLMARIVDGSIAFPMIHEGLSTIASSRNCDHLTNKSLGQTLWEMGTRRDTFGRLVNQFDLQVRYTDDTAYLYPACLINTMEMSVEQEGSVNMNVNIIGGADSSSDVRLPSPNVEPDFLSPARVVTWNDFLIRVYGDEGEMESVRGDWLRSFNVTVDNQVERFFSLNNKLAPQDITARKRQISGSMTIMGVNPSLRELAYTNQDRFTSTARIAFGYSLGSAGTVAFATALHGVVFEIEQIALSNDIIETTVPYTAMADCENGYEATELGNTSSLPTGSNFTPGQFGGRTSAGFPNWSPDD